MSGKTKKILEDGNNRLMSMLLAEGLVDTEMVKAVTEDFPKHMEFNLVSAKGFDMLMEKACDATLALYTGFAKYMSIIMSMDKIKGKICSWKSVIDGVTTTDTVSQ
jgi:hypothetical protein